MATEAQIVIELVVWEDHESLGGGWIDPDTFMEWSQLPPTLCVSVGIVVEESRDVLVLTSALHAHAWGEGQKILKANIKERRILRTYKQLPLPPGT